MSESTTTATNAAAIDNTTTEQQQQQSADTDQPIDPLSVYPSLLSIVESEYSEYKSARCSRILITGLLDNNIQSFNTINRFHSEFIDSVSMNNNDSSNNDSNPNNGNNNSNSNSNNITGVLFVINNSGYVLLLESTTAIILQYLRLCNQFNPTANNTANTANNTNKSPIVSPNNNNSNTTNNGFTFNNTNNTSSTPFLSSNSKILSFIESSPREYSLFASRNIKLPIDSNSNDNTNINNSSNSNNNNNNSSNNSSIDRLKLTFETLRNLLELGRELNNNFTINTNTNNTNNNNSNNNISNNNNNIEKQYEWLLTNNSKLLYQRLPTIDRISLYNQFDDLSSISEFLELFDNPIQFDLESEKVWPTEPFLKY